MAFQSERIYLGVMGGWQDQYAAVFGGLNFIEFNKTNNSINPIRLNNKQKLDFEQNILLCYTGITHNSGNIHSDQKKKTSDKDVKERIKLNVKLTFKIKEEILRGRFKRLGEHLDKSWKYKKTFSSKISNSKLDSIYNGAIKNGASGGKLLGAGGGGYFLFVVTPFKRIELMNWLKRKKLDIIPFKLETNGLKSWIVREN
jgi:D-glycero-alpha-D-manno-heptose-7-phosphate kinase